MSSVARVGLVHGITCSLIGRGAYAQSEWVSIITFSGRRFLATGAGYLDWVVKIPFGLVEDIFKIFLSVNGAMYRLDR